MKKIISILLTFVIIFTAITACAENTQNNDIPPYDYSSFVGTWYNSDEGMSLRILNIDGNNITFEIPALFPAELTYPIVNNQVKWSYYSERVEFQDMLTFYDDSVYYASVADEDKFECWFTSDTIKPCKITTGDYSVILNGNKLDFDQPPIIAGDRVLVPLRKIFEELGATVEYDSLIDTSSPGHYNAKEIFIRAKSNSTELYLTRRWFMNWQYSILSNGEYIDGDTLAYDKGDALPIIFNDRTLVPVRFVSSVFGASVDWDSNTQTVIINTDNSNNNMLTGDFSDFVGVWKNASGDIVDLKSNGTEGKTIIKDSDGKTYHQIAENFTKNENGAFQWNVRFDFTDEENGSYGIWFYPIGINIIVGETIVETDISKVRLYVGQDFVSADEMPNKIFYKYD